MQLINLYFECQMIMNVSVIILYECVYIGVSYTTTTTTAIFKVLKMKPPFRENCIPKSST